MRLSPTEIEALVAHPLADLFPLIEEGEALETLVESVADLGVVEPLVLHEGMLLDGRNRRVALIIALQRHGLAADVEAVEWSELPVDRRCSSPLEFVLTHNLVRRHLTPSQRAIVAANVVTWQRGMNQHSPASAGLQTLSKVAGKFSISERALHAAKRIRERGIDELNDAVRDGRVKVFTASGLLEMDDASIRKALTAPERQIVEEAKAIRDRNKAYSRARRMEMSGALVAAGPRRAGEVPRGPFSVIYADPPWSNEVWSQDSGHDKSPENHYPVMAQADICALLADGKGIAADDCVLFLWRPGNRAQLALEVARAWGFGVVSEIIWDKQRIGTGRWVRDRHEVLMVCTRGAPLPPSSPPPSVYAETRGAHSAKPVWFAQMISDHWPGMAKLELFGRSASLAIDDPRRDPANRWTVWGFEAESEKC